MISGPLFPLALCLYSVVADTDSKRWVWSSARRNSDNNEPISYTGIASSNGYTAALVPPSKSLFQPSSEFEDSLPSPSSKLRYEVSELDEFSTGSSRPTIYPEEQYRPTTSTINGYRPNEYDRPDTGYRPNGGYRPPENSYRPTDNFRPGLGNGYRPPGGSYRPTSGPNGRPILTGPVPSWEQGNDHRYKDYDKCKCVHSFNCNTPGIKFGTCDLDKQYCCYKDVHSHQDLGSDFVSRPRPPVLAGPGGPIDRPGLYRPINSDRHDRPGSGYFSNDRYTKGYRDSNFGLEEAYKKGLDTVIHESILPPSRFDNRRDNLRNYNLDFNRRPHGGKYGLYEAAGSFYGGRSTNSSILADETSKV